MDPKRLYSVASIFIALWAAPSANGDDLTHAATVIKGEVDASEIHRRLVHTQLDIPCRGETLALWYPKWIPGAHAPEGRVEDIGGLRISTPDGAPVTWERDEVEMHRIVCKIPAGTDHILVKLDTICNTEGGDELCCQTFGNSSVGVVNWNSCLLYPEGFASSEIEVRLKLKLPPGWQSASALKVSGQQDALITFAPMSLCDLIDSPLIAGERLRTFHLDAGSNPPAFLHVVSESPAALNLDQKVIDAYSKLVREACALFGAAHYPEYHFLVVCSDDLGAFGLEHHACSLNGVGERDLVDDEKRKGWIANLLPHEYAHSWCGKFRRPRGMCTTDFHSPQRTKLLWVYEGLTQYLGNVLTARAGLATSEESLAYLAADISSLRRREGRRWRPLEDTAVANSLLRSPSRNWNELRRSQDYYDEGALVWLEADVIIRELSHGKRSLDDFCRRLMGPLPTQEKVLPFDYEDVVSALDGVAKHDWDSFLQSRVARAMDALPLDVVGRCGYRLQYAHKPSAPVKQLLQAFGQSGVTMAYDSVGLMIASSGRIISVAPGMSGDKAGLAPGMEIVGVNDRKFSSARFDDALAESVARRKIELLILDQDRFREVTLDYADGQRYLELARDEQKQDRLAEIWKPVAK